MMVAATGRMVSCAVMLVSLLPVDLVDGAAVPPTPGDLGRCVLCTIPVTEEDRAILSGGDVSLVQFLYDGHNPTSAEAGPDRTYLVPKTPRAPGTPRNERIQTWHAKDFPLDQSCDEASRWN